MVDFGKHSVNPLVGFLYFVSASGVGIGFGIYLAIFHGMFTNKIISSSIPITIPTPDAEKKI